MEDKSFLVVIYDISNNKRRTRLHKTLKNYGTPVQYSAFECILTKSEIQKMKKEIGKILRPKSDHLRYYFVCAACKQKIEIVGRVEVVEEQEVIVV